MTIRSFNHSLDRFIVLKTPLDDRYREQIPDDRRWTCPMLIDAVRRCQVEALDPSIQTLLSVCLEKSWISRGSHEYQSFLSRWCWVSTEEHRLRKNPLHRVRYAALAFSYSIFFGKNVCCSYRETPTDAQIHTFIQICEHFIRTHPTDVIGISLIMSYWANRECPSSI